MTAPDADGEAGGIQWNLEKFVLAPDGSVVTRFRPRTTPGDPAALAAIEEMLPALRNRRPGSPGTG